MEEKSTQPAARSTYSSEASASSPTERKTPRVHRRRGLPPAWPNRQITTRNMYPNAVKAGRVGMRIHTQTAGLLLLIRFKFRTLGWTHQYYTSEVSSQSSGTRASNTHTKSPAVCELVLWKAASAMGWCHLWEIRASFASRWCVSFGYRWQTTRHFYFCRRIVVDSLSITATHLVICQQHQFWIKFRAVIQGWS